ncbi:MAG TPA: long-chain fatty acid--CoA ligase [Steroidobacteraceae bacterium]|nr:long-chain fatty acid--CoA ligase [Steroidobacteraceae bacterium]
MHGLMQDHPLLISSLIRHAAANHGRREVVSRLGDGSIHRTNYASVERRARRLARALEMRGIRSGDRVATLAWNTFRHLECFYGVSGLGAVLNTVNPRLFHDQIEYIVRHAENRVLIFDADLLPLVEAIAPQVPCVERYVVMCDRASMPDSRLQLDAYEDWIAGADDDFQWPDMDERAASSLCYTSGTTGNPKGVLYSHRSTLIHALSASQADCFGLSSLDSVMPIAPMFHANAWSLPYACPMMGAKMVLPGRHMDAASLCELLQDEGVTFSVGVPTIWTMLLAHMAERGVSLPKLRRCVVAGTALPPAVQRALKEQHGVTAIHAWGMTETSPIGTMATPTPEVLALPEDRQAEELLKQGRVLYGVEIEVRDVDGGPAPRDGRSFGPLWIRGPWVASGYFKGEGGAVLDANGWFPTGDVATWDEYGFMKITDRTKDVIKSGGEWISSIDVENAAMSHPKVALAAAVAAFHPKWDERPVLVIVPREGQQPTREEILEFLAPRMAKWWLPDDVVFIREMPLTATGKILKAKLREQYWHHLEKHA